MPYEHLTRYHLLHMARKLLPFLKEGDASLGRSADFIYLAGLSFQSLAHSAICWPLLEMPAVQKVERKLLVRRSH